MMRSITPFILLILAVIPASANAQTTQPSFESGGGIHSAVTSSVAGVAGAGVKCAAAGIAIGAGPGAVQRALSVPVSDGILEGKECILDGLTVAIREALIATITDSIIEWINNGFEGGPAFVTDLRGFLGDVADQVGVDFILGEELGFLCSPFQLQVRIALSLQQRPFRENIECSLGDVSDNIQGFLEGDFSRGGFAGLFNISTNYNNNPYGAYVTARAELHGRQTAAVNENLEKFGWSDGLFSSESCDGGTATAGQSLDNEIACERAGGHWTIKTPGTVVNNVLEQSVTSGQRQLELADEIDEIISALLAQLAQKAVTSLDGLRGLSSRSSSSSTASGSYLDRLTETSQETAVASTRDLLILDLAGAISLENQNQQLVGGLINTLEEKRGLVASCSAASPGGMARTVADARLEELEADAIEAVTLIETVIDLQERVAAARTTTTLRTIQEDFNALEESGVLHSTSEVLLLQAEYDAEVTEFEARRTTTADQCSFTP